MSSEATQFMPGQSGNPAGRPKGARSKITVAIEALIDAASTDIATKAIELAKAGDATMIRALLDRAAPPRRDLARLGIRGFRPTLAQASKQLEALRTPEGSAVPANTLAELRRDMARLSFVKQQIKEIETARAKRLEQTHGERRTAMVRLLARVVGVGIESADLLVQEVFSRELRDRKAVARYAGLTGGPDESGQKRRERGLAKAGNARVRRSMIELAWGHLLHQKDSPLADWYRRRTADARGGTRKTMIVALARKFLITLWRLVTTGEAPAGLRLRPAA
jgi:transposase